MDGALSSLSYKTVKIIVCFYRHMYIREFSSTIVLKAVL